MADTGDGGYSSGSEGGKDSSGEVSDSSFETAETAETELYTSEAETELYDPGYDPSEYEAELTDFSYEVKDPSTQIPDESGEKVNSKGEPVEDVPLYRSDEYLNYDDPEYIETGKHSVDWPENGGFEGEPTETTLPPDTVIVRYGPESGRFGTDKGTDHSKLSLPYDGDTQEYHEYRVCKDVSCKSGKAKAGFDVEGGGTQYMFSKSFAEMVNDGTLERI